MSREWQEGDVATGLHHGDWVTLIRSARPAPRGKWLRLDNLGFDLHRGDVAVTDVRPLVVIDPMDIPPGAEVPGWLCAEIERQTMGPRMPEPGWGEKVIAHTEALLKRQTWLSVDDDPPHASLWKTRALFQYVKWADLIDPQPWDAS